MLNECVDYLNKWTCSSGPRDQKLHTKIEIQKYK